MWLRTAWITVICALTNKHGNGDSDSSSSSRSGGNDCPPWALHSFSLDKPRMHVKCPSVHFCSSFFIWARTINSKINIYIIVTRFRYMDEWYFSSAISSSPSSPWCSSHFALLCSVWLNRCHCHCLSLFASFHLIQDLFHINRMYENKNLPTSSFPTSTASRFLRHRDFDFW